jgi:hypothetical protein
VRSSGYPNRLRLSQASVEILSLFRTLVKQIAEEYRVNAQGSMQQFATLNPSLQPAWDNSIESA